MSMSSNIIFLSILKISRVIWPIHFTFFLAARTHKYGRQKPAGDYGDDDEEGDDYGDAGNQSHSGLQSKISPHSQEIVFFF